MVLLQVILSIALLACSEYVTLTQEPVLPFGTAAETVLGSASVRANYNRVVSHLAKSPDGEHVYSSTYICNNEAIATCNSSFIHWSRSPYHLTQVEASHSENILRSEMLAGKLYIPSDGNNLYMAKSELQFAGDDAAIITFARNTNNGSLTELGHLPVTVLRNLDISPDGKHVYALWADTDLTDTVFNTGSKTQAVQQLQRDPTTGLLTQTDEFICCPYVVNNNTDDIVMEDSNFDDAAKINFINIAVSPDGAHVIALTYGGTNHRLAVMWDRDSTTGHLSGLRGFTPNNNAGSPDLTYSWWGQNTFHQALQFTSDGSRLYHGQFTTFFGEGGGYCGYALGYFAFSSTLAWTDFNRVEINYNDTIACTRDNQNSAIARLDVFSYCVSDDDKYLFAEQPVEIVRYDINSTDGQISNRTILHTLTEHEQTSRQRGGGILCVGDTAIVTLAGELTSYLVTDIQPSNSPTESPSTSPSTSPTNSPTKSPVIGTPLTIVPGILAELALSLPQPDADSEQGNSSNATAAAAFSESIRALSKTLFDEANTTGDDDSILIEVTGGGVSLVLYQAPAGDSVDITVTCGDNEVKVPLGVNDVLVGDGDGDGDGDSNDRATRPLRAVVVTVPNIHGTGTPSESTAERKSGVSVTGVQSSMVTMEFFEIGAEGEPDELLKAPSLSIPLEITFPVTETVDDNMACGWWDHSISMWSTQGCLTIITDTNTVTCKCCHCTDFALIRLARSALSRGRGDVGTANIDPNVARVTADGTCQPSVNAMLAGGGTGITEADPMITSMIEHVFPSFLGLYACAAVVGLVLLAMNARAYLNMKSRKFLIHLVLSILATIAATVRVIALALWLNVFNDTGEELNQPMVDAASIINLFPFCVNFAIVTNLATLWGTALELDASKQARMVRIAQGISVGVGVVVVSLVVVYMAVGEGDIMNAASIILAVLQVGVSVFIVYEGSQLNKAVNTGGGNKGKNRYFVRATSAFVACFSAQAAINITTSADYELYADNYVAFQALYYVMELGGLVVVLATAYTPSDSTVKSKSRARVSSHRSVGPKRHTRRTQENKSRVFTNSVHPDSKTRSAPNDSSAATRRADHEEKDVLLLEA